MKRQALFLLLLFVGGSLLGRVPALAQGDRPALALDWLLTCDHPWEVTPDEFEREIGKRKFIWQDPERTRARFDPERYHTTVMERKVGEVLVFFRDGRMSGISISVLNKGDEDEIIGRTEFNKAVEAVRSILGGLTGVQEEPRKKNEMVTRAEGAVWRSKKGLYIGEWLFLPTQKFEQDGWIWTIREHGEFVRIRVFPPNSMLGTQQKQSKVAVSRQLLASRVKRDANSAIIEGIPMVDQGNKGYCAVASFERVLRYYGAEIDMHDLATLAETYGGTDPQKMKDAVYRVARKVGMNTREPFFLKEKQYRFLFNEYDRAARKAGRTLINLDTRSTSPWVDVDTGLMKEVRTKSSDFNRFKQEIVNSINKGIPLMWALQLGLFWEDGLEDSYEVNRFAKSPDTPEDVADAERERREQEFSKKRREELRKKYPERPPAFMMGGHMRLIVGYDKQEAIIYYTDSWGPGHELKKMPVDLAFTGTTALFIIEPP